MNPHEADEAAHFVAKWQARWPEWPVMEVFVPIAMREPARAWAALQQELLDAAWAGEDARPGLAKLAWWQDELRGWTRGMRRHPLAVHLKRDGVPWGMLADALEALPATRERARDLDDALSLLQRVATAAARVEDALFGGETPPATVAMTWLAARALQSGKPAVPLQMLASAQPEAAVAGWRRALVAQWPRAFGASRPRRLWAALARARLQSVRPGEGLGPFRSLLLGWRAARN